jgi:TatA/E family protein of Tat protein translocase
MFGTLGFSELILILAIILIIFGAGRLPQVGEGVGKALRSFKKEVHDVPPDSAQVQQNAESSEVQAQPTAVVETQAPAAGSASTNITPNIPYVPGPEMTPGTTASLLYNVGPQSAPSAAIPNRGVQAATAVSTQPVVSMEERAAAPAPMARGQYPPLPPGVQQKPSAKRPSAIVNKDAVARVQAQQAAMKAKAELAAPGLSPKDMQNLGEGMGDMLRTFRQAVADVRDSVDPQMRTIQAEIDAAQKEIQQSLEAAAEGPAVQVDPEKSA